MSDKRRWPLTHMIHDINHTQTNRSAFVIHSAPSITIINSYTLGTKLTDLTGGIYRIVLGSTIYFFDLYKTLTGDDYLEIDNYDNAFMVVDSVRYPIILYKNVTSTVSSYKSYSISNTVNNWFDTLIVSGYTSQSGTGNIDSPVSIKSTTSLSFTVGKTGSKTEEYTINLRNYIKSLPNNYTDICIINSELQKYHIMTVVGRTIFSGYENWVELTDYSSDDYSVFFYANSNVKLASSNNNMRCSHLPIANASDIISRTISANCIATSNVSSIGNGFLIGISTSLLDYVSNESHESHFKDWLNGIFTSGNAMVVEYPLATVENREFLIEEYHIPTYFGGTDITINTTGCNLSYFYKSL